MNTEPMSYFTLRTHSITRMGAVWAAQWERGPVALYHCSIRSASSHASGWVARSTYEQTAGSST